MAGLRRCEDAQEHLTAFAQAVAIAADLQQQGGPGDVVLTPGDVEAAARLPAAGRRDLLAQVAAVLRTEAWGSTGSSRSEDDPAEWSFSVGRGVRPFRGITSIEDFEQKKALIEQKFDEGATVEAVSVAPPKTDAVFVVHGRNLQARDAMFAFLRAIGLKPIEWSQAVAMTGKASPYVGEVLDAAFANAQAIVVLLTPDEVTYLRPEYAADENDPDAEPAAQARPNVLFEAGMAMGRNADRTVLIELGAMRPFSDILGRHTVRIDGSAERRTELAQRLTTAGCSVDVSGTDWLSAGDFLPPQPPGAGLPLGRRVPAGSGRSRIKIDLRYHDMHNSGRLEVINSGTEAVFDLSLEFPEEASAFSLHGDDLPIKRLPSGKSATLLAWKHSGMGERSRSHFDVTVTGRTEAGEAVREEVFLDLGA